MSTICHKPACPNRKPCPIEGHQPKARHTELDSRRGLPKERGYDKRWDKASKGYLASNRLCVACHREGRVGAAVLTDHIVPVRERPDLFWVRQNWQPLCRDHHADKTRREGVRNGRQAGASCEHKALTVVRMEQACRECGGIAA
jgi:5-methylcytosine-specific restriction protein A